jgi:FlaA1/EpsC-like NDP-sugar epimerase
VRNRYVLLADLLLIPAAVFLAFSLRFDLGFVRTRPEFVPFLAAALIIKPCVYLWFGLYRRFWRYASMNDMLLVLLAVSTASVVLAVASGAAVYMGYLSSGLSRAVVLMDWMLSLLTVSGVRVAVRVVGESRGRPRIAAGAREPKRVLIVGAGEAGTIVIREMQRNRQLELEPVGFLDDDRRKTGKTIHGVLVMGDIASLERTVTRERIDDVVIAMPLASGSIVRGVAERCQALGLRCRTIPGIFELLDDQVTVNRLRKVDIADLLRRSEVNLSQGADAYLRGRTVLITGAGGSIGSELCRQVARARPRRLIILGHGENSIFDAQSEIQRAFPATSVVAVIADIRDRNRLTRVMTEWKPDIVLHAAAHKHVPLMEDNPQEAVSNNVLGTRNVVEAAMASDVERLVMISTDKAVAPSNLMGASKRMAEMIVRDAARRSGRAYIVVRFGNVLGSRGSVVPIFKRQIELGGPITITHPEMRRFFMTIPEAVHLVLQAGGMGSGGELFVLNMGEPVRIVDLAEDLVRLSGFQPGDISIIFTGLRPGEKLDEQLWESGSVVTPVEGVDLRRIIEPDDPTAATLRLTVEKLERAVEADDYMEMAAALASCISTFVPSPHRAHRAADARA